MMPFIIRSYSKHFSKPPQLMLKICWCEYSLFYFGGAESLKSTQAAELGSNTHVSDSQVFLSPELFSDLWRELGALEKVTQRLCEQPVSSEALLWPSAPPILHLCPWQSYWLDGDVVVAPHCEPGCWQLKVAELVPEGRWAVATW